MPPKITIIDWSLSPQSDGLATVEREVIGNYAEVQCRLCAGDGDFDASA